MKSFLLICLIFCSNIIQAQSVFQLISQKSDSLPFPSFFHEILQEGEKLRQPLLPDEKQKLITHYNTINRQLQDSIGQYIQSNPSNESAALLSLHYFFDIRKDTSFLRTSLQIFKQFQVQNSYVTYIQEELDGLNNAQIGKVIPLFSLVDISKHTQIIPTGHRLLLIFWASWCVPCRAELEQLKEVYSQLKSKGLDIVSVNLDEDKNRWLAASKQEILPWINCYAPGAWESKIARFFTLHQIPQNALLDEKGKIINRNVPIAQLLK